MFVSRGLYDSRLEYIDLDDLTFFKQALEFAKNEDLILALGNKDKSFIKQNLTPAVFLSKLSKQLSTEVILNRKGLDSGGVDWSRARRKFIMLDLDFNEDQVELSNETYDKLIELAKRLNTYLIIYPTISYPKKPRFRAVFFSDYLLTEVTYHQAVSWIYQQINLNIMDSADVNLKMNRNLPVFDSFEQVERIYNNTDNEELQLMNHKLWSNMPKPKIKRAKVYTEEEYEANYSGEITLEDVQDLMIFLSNTDLLKEYATFWQFINSIAASYINNQINLEIVEYVLEESANLGSNEFEIKQWKEDNQNLFETHFKRLKESSDELRKARPLKKYFEIIGLPLKSKFNKENEDRENN